MGKKQVKKVASASNTSVSNFSVKANEKLLKEEIQFLINDPISRDKLITVAINSKDLRILELFSKNDGKLTAPEISKHFEFIAASDRVDLLKYFIETLKLDFKKPVDGLNPISMLHFSAMYGAKNCTEYLLSKKFDINQPDGGNYLPVEYAILSNHTDIVKLLIQKGTKIDEHVISNLAIAYKAKHDEATKLLDAIPNNLIKLDSYLLYEKARNHPSIKNDTSLSNTTKANYAKFLERLKTIEEDVQLRSNYYKLILGKEYHLLPKVIEIQQQFINSKISSISEYQDESRKDILRNISDTIVSAINVHKIFKFNERPELENYIIEVLEKNKNLSKIFSDVLLLFCSRLMQEVYDQGDNLRSIKYAKIIEENLSTAKALSKEDQVKAFNNLGIVYSNFNSLKALDYLSKAEQLDPSQSQSIIVNKHNIYLNTLHNPNAAIAEAEKITDNDLKSLLLITTYLTLPNSQNLEAFNTILAKYNFDKLSLNKFNNDSSKSQLYYNIQAKQYTYNGQFELAYSAYDKILKQAVTTNNNQLFYDTTHNCLVSFLKQKDFTNGCKFLNKIYQKYPAILANHNILALKHLELIFYNSNDQYLNKCDKILADIKSEVLIDKKWVEFIVAAYSSKFYQANSNQQVKIYIQNIEKLYGDSLNNSEIPAETKERLLYLIKEGTFIQAILSSNEDHLLNEVPIESTPKETEIIETSTLSSDKMIYEPFVRSVSEAPKDKDSFKKIEAIINAEDHAALIQFDQKLVQKYFKYKKEKLHKQQVQKLLGSKKTISWHIDDGVDFTTKSEEVIKVKKDWYAVIDSNLKLEKVTFDIFTNALKKGVVHRSEGENGVKFFGDKIELKIDQDSRLYPSIVYRNGDKHLIIFDKEGNHNAIKDADEYTIIPVGDSSNLIGELSTFEMPV